MTKGKLREIFMQCIFQMEAQKDSSMKLAELFLDDMKLSDKDKRFILKRVAHIRENLEDIDKIIDNFAKTFTSQRMDKVCLAALRVCIFEIKIEKEVPAAVAINEAVRITKEYSTESSASLVNGILGSYMRSGENEN